MGGIPRRSAETGSHVVRLFAERQRERKASYALVFVDAVDAFCSVVRDALWGYGISFKWSLQRQN